ncbi:Flp pilus assembly complex ATPase component TadA [Aeoliella sp. ICT_H6.2]|uniref:Flp pilus assembly complex ATPase component TadA n=1 Tax=Aeoliella straminimaris TaxID=2954799 RepID=A0A9X2FHK6_9BACT|nr:ATPase, T2SS/T4P/T4SS family [Aeoliella straminimaris]MCO6045031.1 Flp pilus assembly complex ATPase component TadA [Aeoliella straminimaris]
MNSPPSTDEPLAAWQDYLASIKPQGGSAVELVDRLLQLVSQSRASDVHIDPTEGNLVLRWRLDGVLAPLGTVPRAMASSVVGRLKVLAGLLTYETALPQEGRLESEVTGGEFRVSTFPTLFGERAVLRSLGSSRRGLETLEQLGLGPNVLDAMRDALAATTGAVLIVGPAGSGKTTTAYAAVREVVEQSGGGRAIHSLEDPVEVVVPGVAQSQVSHSSGFTMAEALKSLVRQDPEVLMLGEIRDRATAATTLEAALTGSLVITTFHAGSTSEAIDRLVDMGIPADAVQHAVRLVVAQRLVRRLCTCALQGEPSHDAAPLGLDVAQCMGPAGCGECAGTGYRGRVLLAEASTNITPHQTNSTMPFAEPARQLIESGVTSPGEVVRALGWRPAVDT